VVAFLEELEPSDREEFIALALARRFARGVAIFHAGDDRGSVMVVQAGHVKVATIARDGREVVLGVDGPGELLGELSAIDGTTRSATITALDAVEVLSVPGEAFRALLERRPRIALVLLRRVAARLRAADRQLLEYASYDVLGRVAHRLLKLAEHSGPGGPDGVVIDLALTQDDLAAWTAASREAVSKALSAMQKLGWIQTGRRTIIVRDIEALRRHTDVM
jgi:CRP/FNR family cyclic AMP-dependent transcriptional regulator